MEAAKFRASQWLAIWLGCVSWCCAPPAGAQPSLPGGDCCAPKGDGAVPAAPIAVSPEPMPALPAALAAPLREARLPASAVGIYVQEVGSGKPLLALNADRPMNPASVMKLVTTYAALELMGPAFVWKTGIYETGSRRGDILDGDLVFKGVGDPKLTEQDLWMALKQVRARGIREVRGNIVLDRGAFDAAG